MRRFVSLVVVLLLFAGTFAFAGERKLPTTLVLKNDSKMTMSYRIRPWGPYLSTNGYIVIVAKPGKTFDLTVNDLKFENLTPSDGDPVRLLITASPVDGYNMTRQYDGLIFVKASYFEKERRKKVKLTF